MAVIKKRVLQLSTGKQVKLSGMTLCITSFLEVGEGFTRNILYSDEDRPKEASPSPVANPYGLTQDEIMEMADYCIGLWMQLKDRIRQHGIKSPEIFRRNP
ncbi:hypothetical protein [Chitinophaga tropicalis]|uniref:Uncharacterized protein n=1 Tax=Chitinophaga tropicalis TaxID=2683588 RepID=A0A7K1U0B0_9BACT|nr:hypothetical protein [Chitinophaga tropicalis]MVT07736.1 hypothetical protein [Chitinophaga tropicalis]